MSRLYAVRRLLPSSLSGRLVATLVAVVLVATVLVAVATSLAIRSFLNGQLDDQVQQNLDRSVGRYESGISATPPLNGDDGGGDGDHGPRIRFGLGDAEGTLEAQFVGSGGAGSLVRKDASQEALPTPALAVLQRVPADKRSHLVHLDGVGTFRVRAVADGSALLVAGQSTARADDLIGNLVLVETLLGGGALVVAVGAGQLLVRRQLRPLRQVAGTAHTVSTLPLSSGAIGTTVRVPDELTDERTEVGQVGSALNALLEHVEHALDERHRSELQVRQFVADASHELRTPLTTIHGYAELSRRTSPPDPETLSLAMMKVEAEATRMSSLVEDLLLLARLDAGRPLASDEVDLTRLALEAVGDARVVGRDHKWRLDLPDEPVVAPGDEQRLHQVLTNLLNNARRHTPPGTSVTVGVRHDDQRVVLSVLDDGPGLPPQLADSAFERFTRGDSARTRESGGAGLGLSLVQAIALAHGGSVSVDSAPGRTRFEVRLPAPA
ncbi:MAG: HAMP domain-containing sensor histidine kinase [Nocardioidaceae bacterium]